MTVKRVDLYEYFKVSRPEGGAGYLNCYIIDKYDGEFAKGRIRPAMLVIAGGGYHYVSLREKEPIALHYVAEGFNAFTLEYSVVSVSYPAQLLEGCMAMAYIRENAEEFGIDTAHVAAIGFSAGGHLCGMLATMYDEKEVTETLKERAALCRPDGVILAYPVILAYGKTHEGSLVTVSGGNKELRDRLSIEKNVDEKSSPAFIWCTANDGAVPAENSLELAMAYKRVDVPFELHIFEDGQHGLSLATSETVPEVPAVQPWFDLSVTWLKNRGFRV